VPFLSSSSLAERPDLRTKAGRRLAPLFSSAVEMWATPAAVYADLNEEFCFTLDPCPLMSPEMAGLPLFGTDGLYRSWHGERVFCNPPYGRGVGRWLVKAAEANVAVYLLPARTDTRWWHEHAMRATEIRFLRGRLRFGGAETGAPFPSVVVIFNAVPVK